MSSSTLTAGPQRSQRSVRPASAAGACLAAAAFLASGILQVTDLHWVINKVQTGPQHVVMALFVVALAGTMPALAWLGRRLGRTGRIAAGSVVAGQLVICAITTQSNITGLDAPWFNTAAVVANLLWVPPLIVLVVLAYRSAVVPRPLAIGLVLAYAGTIPLSAHGGGLLAAAYWAMFGVQVWRTEAGVAGTGHPGQVTR